MLIFSEQPLFLKKTLIGLVFCVLLMWLDTKELSSFNYIRAISHQAIQPVYQFSLVPNFARHWGGDIGKTKEALRRENSSLQAQLMKAHVKIQKLDYQLAQNSRLQDVLLATNSEQYTSDVAQIIGVDRNPSKQVVIINRGSRDGVEVGQTAVDENGIIGQVINTYEKTSRLLLITDETQSVAVVIKRTGQRAVVSGKGHPNELNLDYIFKSSDVRLGDELVSSGLGDRMPAGHSVGRISHIDAQQTDDNFISIKVLPSANFINNSYLLLLKKKNKA